MNAWCVPHRRGCVQGQRHLSCGAPTYEGSPAPSAGSVHSISRWTSASPRLPCAAVGPSPCTTLSTGPLPCATPRSPAVRMCPRTRAAQPGLSAVLQAVSSSDKQAGELAPPQPLPEPLVGCAGGPCPAVVHQEQVCAVGWPCLPRQALPGGGHPCHQMQLLPASHQDVGELGWHPPAAGVRAEVLSSRAHARTTQVCAMRSLPCRICHTPGSCPSSCPRPHAKPPPKAPTWLRSARVPGSGGGRCGVLALQLKLSGASSVTTCS